MPNDTEQRLQIVKAKQQMGVPLSPEERLLAQRERELTAQLAANQIEQQAIAGHRRRNPDYSPGGIGQDIDRSAVSLMDFLAGMGVEAANEASRGLFGLYGTTPLRNFGGNYPLNPEQDDVRTFMEGAPQFPNPFPMTEGGQSRAETLGRWTHEAINSKFGRKAQEVESKLEDIANRYLGPEAAGTVFATTLGIAGTFDPIPGTTPKVKPGKALTTRVGPEGFDYHNPSPDHQRFIAIGDMQRGKPEQVMLKAQRKLGGGVMQVMVEHVGDLTHRMTEKTAFANGDMGFEFVKPKVDRALNMLRNRYGFEREFLENIDANRRYAEENPQYGNPVDRAEIDGILKEYAQAHSELPAYNDMQRAARDAAVALGEQDFARATRELEKLESVLNEGREAWVQEASKFDAPAQAQAPKKPTALTKADRQRLDKLAEKYPDIRPLMRFLTPDEQRALNGQNVGGVLEAWGELDPSEMASVAMAGRAKRGWYEKSSKALNELFGEEDAPRFAALLASLSPQTSVESNLRYALNVWNRWDEAGRPRDPDAILQLMGDAVEGDKGVDSVLGACRQNAIESLTVDDILEHQLSGAKVDSFMRNIWGNFQEVTNDAWVAKYTGLDQGRFSSSRSAAGPGKKTGIYVGINAATRKAADLLSKRTGEKWTPAEIQETVWSWAKSISEKADSTQTPITELITKLTNSEVSDTPDFGTLLSQPGEFHDILIGGGFNEQQLANLGGAAGAGSRAAVDPTGSSASAAGIQSRHLDAAAQRLESARRAERRPPVYDSLRQSVERSLAGEAAPAYRRRDRGDNRGYVASTFELPKERQGTLNSLGHSTPPVVELRQGNQQAANKFHKAITAASESHPSGAQVYVYTPEEYAGMRLFQTEDGKAGFAIKPDGDIVSVFNHRNSKHRGITPNLLMLAIEQGGTKLDAFDTYLPHLYEQFGFREVSREPWNEAFKPDGWDKDVYRKYNNGEPDVVYMEYEPTKGVGEVAAEVAPQTAVQGATRSVGDYGDFGTMVNMLKHDPLAAARAESLNNVDLSRFDETLRKTVK